VVVFGVVEGLFSSTCGFTSAGFCGSSPLLSLSASSFVISLTIGSFFNSFSFLSFSSFAFLFSSLSFSARYFFL
jgi:hypothetical protein